jgi:hypothetical protein
MDYIGFLFEKAGSTPAAKHIANKQEQTSFYYKQVRRIHPDYVTDTTRTHYTT